MRKDRFMDFSFQISPTIKAFFGLGGASWPVSWYDQIHSCFTMLGRAEKNSNSQVDFVSTKVEKQNEGLWTPHQNETI